MTSIDHAAEFAALSRAAQGHLLAIHRAQSGMPVRERAFAAQIVAHDCATITLFLRAGFVEAVPISEVLEHLMDLLFVDLDEDSITEAGA
ncbi:MAG TPA: hypothetical protein VNS81_00195 [Nocardioides sp.]|nr:hypothetical protein [Nocardioides sp.]